MLIDNPAKAPLLQEGGGFAMIYGPDGAPLCEPIPETQEGLLYADVDLGMIGVAKAAYDPVGHYSRPDVLRLLFNRKRVQRVEIVADERNSNQYPENEAENVATDSEN